MNLKDLEEVNYMEKLVIYLEKGSTKCEDCPFSFYDNDGNIFETLYSKLEDNFSDCDKFDLNSIKKSDEI